MEWRSCASLAVFFSLGLASAAAAQTQQVGTVTVCYYSPECAFATMPSHAAGLPGPLRVVSHRDLGEHRSARPTLSSASPVDAPAFEFTNTGSAPIVSAQFSISANPMAGVASDTFKIGAIAPGASFVIVPGASNDDKAHASGAFFAHSASNTPLDTSDTGPNSNSLKFTFTGKISGVKVTSGTIAVKNSVARSTDGTVAAINFLGGPGNADGPCNDCVAPKVVATIVAE